MRNSGVAAQKRSLALTSQKFSIARSRSGQPNEKAARLAVRFRRVWAFARLSAEEPCRLEFF